MQFFTPTVNSQRYAARYQGNPPPPVARPLTWEIEMNQRQTDRTKFPDYGMLFGASTNNTGYTPAGGREPLPYHSPFTMPYAEPKSTVATVSGVEKRAWIDTPPVDASKYEVYSEHDMQPHKRTKF